MTGRRISLGRLAPERFRSAPQGVVIAVAVAVVLLAALLSAVLSPGGGGSDAAAASPTGDQKGGTGQDSVPSSTKGTHTPATTPPPSVAAVPESIQHQPEAPGRAVNITIDDGPDPRWTPQVLDVLKKHHAHATFCMIGPQAEANPALVRRVVAEGHRLCDHTVSHNESMDHMPFAYQQKEIMDALDMIEDASGGAPVRYYRAPGGAFTPASRKLAAQHGMRPLGWNVDTKDFTRPGVGTIVATVRSEISNGPTILFHDGGGDRSQTVEAVARLLPRLTARGWRFTGPARHA